MRTPMGGMMSREMMVDCFSRHPVAAVLENSTAAESDEVMGHRRAETRYSTPHICHCNWLVRTSHPHFNWTFILAVPRRYCHHTVIRAAEGQELAGSFPR